MFVKGLSEMLTASDTHFISLLLSQSSERYPLSLAYTFTGKKAFDLHAAMIHLDDDWIKSVSEADKAKALLVVMIQTTVSKASLKNSVLHPPAGRRNMKVVFRIPPDVAYSKSATAFKSPKGKKWLKMLHEASLWQ